MSKRLLLLGVSLASLVLASASPAAAYHQASNVYWGPTSDGCAGITMTCDALLAVQAWPSNSPLGEPFVMATDSKSACDYSWYQHSDESYTLNGYWYAATYVYIPQNNCGNSNGNWRLMFDAPGG